MKKIYICTEAFNLGGVSSALKNIINYLINHPQEFEFKIICFSTQENSEIPENFIPYACFIPELFYQKYFFKSVIPTYKFCKKNEDAIFVFANIYDGFLIAWLKKLRIVKNKIALSYASHPNVFYVDLKTRKMSKLHKILYSIHYYLNFKTLSTYDSNLFLTNRTREILPNNIKMKHYAIVENPVGQNFFDIQLPKIKQNNIMMIARIEELKGFDLLPKIILELTKIRKDFKFIIYGSGRYEKEFKEIIKEKNLEKFIELNGVTKDVATKLKEGKILLSLSRAEGLPNNLLEGIAVGLPLVAFDCFTGPKEIINSTNGLLVEVEDIQGVVNAINVALDKDWNNELIKKLAFERYNIDTISSDYANYYKQLCVKFK